jgi:soluble lytic murein transglycosylase-like protein
MYRIKFSLILIVSTLLIINIKGLESQAKPIIHNKYTISETSIAGISVLLDNSNGNVKPVELSESYYIKGIPLSKDLQSYIYNQCKSYNVDYYLVLSIIQKESSYKSNVISKDGHDYGLCQIRDINHEYLRNQLNKDLNFLNPYDNVLSCIYMLSNLFNKYQSYNLSCILMSYNQGEYGAKKSFSNNIYSSEYSRVVMSIYNSIKSDNVNYVFR